MIRSSGSYISNDVCVKCRVRRSPFAINPKFGDAGEYTCTMRNWEARHSDRQLSSATAAALNAARNGSLNVPPHHQGPELVLTPIRTLLSTRDDSPVRRNQVNPIGGGSNTDSYSYSIPIDEIIVVDTVCAKKRMDLTRINITTLSLGYFEFDCITRNGYDILLAFLSACVPSERMVDRTCTVVEEGSTVRSTSSVTSCLDLDVDAMTAKLMRGRAERETFGEKFSRRIGRVAHTIQELSTTICEMTCCQNPGQVNLRHDEEQRDRPPSHPCELEMDENDSIMPTSPSTVTTDNNTNYYYQQQLERRHHHQTVAAP